MRQAGGRGVETPCGCIIIRESEREREMEMELWRGRGGVDAGR